MSPQDDIRPTEIFYPELAMPGPGAATKVAPGIYWLRMTLPFALDHINLWLIEDGDGWTMIDTGLATGETKDLWRQHFTGTMGGKLLHRIIVTHFHPDHIGNAGWIAAERDARLWITRTEWLMHQMLVMDQDAVLHNGQVDAYELAGLDATWTTNLRAVGNTYRDRVEQAPTAYQRIHHGDEFKIGSQTWQVIIGTGHSLEHACLYCPELGVLISGDQILPKITPNITLWANDLQGDPLGDYLDSLALFTPLPANTLVLPSHGLPFTGLHARLAQLAAHHEDRLNDIINACNQPMTATDFLPVLYKRTLDLHQIGFAMGEAMAHLTHLVLKDRIRVEEAPNGEQSYTRR